MNATFNIKVSIDSNNVSTSFGSEGITDMDTSLLASILKVFGDVQNRVKTQVAKFYGVAEKQTDISQAEGQVTEAANETGDQQ